MDQPTQNTSTVIPISTHHHLPIKLTSTTFPSWRAHLCALLNGFSLIGHIDGTTPQPDSATQPAAATRWFQQEQLLLAAILGSVSPDILPLLSSSANAAAAYNTLSRAFASTSRAHVMFLKTSLTKATLGAKSIAEYVNHIKALTDELSLIDAPVKDDDLTLYIINGLGSEYRDIVSSVRTRETPFRFEELRDRLIEHESYLKQIESAASTLVATANVAHSIEPQSCPFSRSHGGQRGGAPSSSCGRGCHGSNCGGRGGGRGHFSSNRDSSITCQIYGYKNHTAPYCRRLQPNANFTHSPLYTPPQSWLMDSGESHNLTSDLSNLSIHFEYDGTDEINIADGSGLPISRTGISHIHTPSRSYLLSDVLYVPGAAKNLISVHQFTKANNVSLEFFPNHFLI